MANSTEMSKLLFALGLALVACGGTAPPPSAAANERIKHVYSQSDVGPSGINLYCDTVTHILIYQEMDHTSIAAVRDPQDC